MIPVTGWSENKDKLPEATYGLEKPVYSSVNKFFITLGPSSLFTSLGVLNAAFWKFEVVSGAVYAAKYNQDGYFEPAVNLFNSGDVDSMSATFDQLGNSIVFYCQNNELKLWWFDPSVAQTVISSFGVGSNPFATFDIRYNVSNPTSDAILFYLKGGAIYYRQQRDRYAVEYQAPDEGISIDQIVQADMSEDYRMQVVFRYKDTGYKPPDPIPPIVVPQTGYWKYRLTGYGSRISIERNFWFDTKDDLTVSFIIDEVELDKPDIAIFSQCFATHSVEQGSSQGRYGAQLLATVGGANHDVLTLIVGGYKSVLPMPVKLQPGSWSFVMDSGLITVSFTSVDLSSTITQAPMKYAIGKSLETAHVLTFGGDGSIAPKTSFRGIMREIRASSLGREIYCPVDDKNSEVGGEYLAVYNADRTTKLYNARIRNNYRSDNWIFQPT